jgi:hypothetical protein
LQVSFYFYAAILLGLTIWSWHFYIKFRMKKPYCVIPIYLLIVFIVEVTSKLMAWIIQNNGPIYHLMNVVQVLFIGFIYSHAFGRKKINLVRLMAAITLLFCIANSLFIEGIWAFPINNLTTISFFALLLVLFHLREMLLNPSEKPLLQESMFWINLSQLIFFGMTFFLWPFLIGIFEFALWVSASVMATNLAMYITLFYGLYQQRSAST